MKRIIVVIALAGAAAALLYSMLDSEAKIDPVAQTAEARAKIAVGDSWTDVIDAIGTPSRWRKEMASDPDADPYGEERWDEGTFELIQSGIEKGEHRLGFAFHYRYSKHSGFTANFRGDGHMSNIRDHLSKADLLDR